MKSYTKNKICVLLLACMMILTAVIPSSLAKAATTGSIQLVYAPIEGVTFDLYKVGKMDGNDGYELYGDFINSRVNLLENTAAATLKGYVESEKLSPLATSSTDSTGNVYFKNLEEGAYLILGHTIKVGNITYTANPVLLSVPSMVLNKYTWDVVADGKYTTDEEGTGQYYTSIAAQKVWEDSNDKYNKRPSEITLELLENGVVKYTQTLSAANNWTYTWSESEYKLAKSSEWTIVEKNVDENYTVKVEKAQSGTNVVSFVCTNTYNDESSTTTSKTSTTSSSSTKKSSSLPQTGQLWWPVLILLCGGLLCLIFGVLLSRKRR